MENILGDHADRVGRRGNGNKNGVSRIVCETMAVVLWKNFESGKTKAQQTTNLDVEVGNEVNNYALDYKQVTITSNRAP